MGFANHYVLFLSTFYTASQLFWNWGCVMFQNADHRCFVTLTVMCVVVTIS